MLNRSDWRRLGEKRRTIVGGSAAGAVMGVEEEMTPSTAKVSYSPIA